LHPSYGLADPVYEELGSTSNCNYLYHSIERTTR
jgi:hypothetical protein